MDSEQLTVDQPTADVPHGQLTAEEAFRAAAARAAVCDAAGEALSGVFLGLREKLIELDQKDLSTSMLNDLATELFLVGMEIESWLHTIAYVAGEIGAPVARDKEGS